MKLSKKSTCLSAAVLVLAAVAGPKLFGGAFVPLKDVAPVADLEHEAAAQHATLAGLLKDKESFEDMENRKKKIPRAAGVLAVLGQAIAEHPDKAKVKVAGTDLRDAARKVVTAKSYEEATAGLAEIGPALSGKSSGKAETEYAWNKLMSLHRLMEEVKARHVALREVSENLQKGKAGKPEEDARHASMLAVLALPMYADTHEVKKPEEVPQWQEWSKEFRRVSTELSAAVRKSDAEGVKTLLPQATKLCGECHDQFRH